MHRASSLQAGTGHGSEVRACQEEEAAESKGQSKEQGQKEQEQGQTQFYGGFIFLFSQVSRLDS